MTATTSNHNAVADVNAVGVNSWLARNENSFRRGECQNRDVAEWLFLKPLVGKYTDDGMNQVDDRKGYDEQHRGVS
jgi:hypothetical protein